MSYTVEGEEIDPAELRDGTWQHPKCPADPLDLQKRFGRKKTDPTELTEELGLAGASAASKNKSRPPQLPRRKPMPRLPEEDYKIVLRPKCAVNLTNIGLIALLEAIYATSKINQAQAEQADQVRVHPIKNTITISTPDRTRADAYRTLESLRCEEHNIDIPVSAYVPAPDDSIRGLVYRAYTNETDQAIHDEIANKNPQLPIVNARRLGNSKHFVITFAGRDLPSLIRYRCFTLNVYPFRERPEACFNCRKLGHRSDVCPQPRPEIPRCRRCGEEHSPPPEGEKPTCIPLCVVCHGTHPTGSRNCKRRFIQPKQNKKTTSQSDTQTTGETRRSHSRGRTQGVFRDRSESFPPLHSREIDQSTSGGNTSQQDEPAKHVAWGSGKPNLRDKTTPQVTTSLGTPPEQQSRNGRTTTQTREERSGYKISQAAREEGTPTRPQQSKPQQQQDQQVRELAEQIKFLKQQLAAANDKIRQLENKPTPISTSQNLCANRPVVCAPSEAENMETDVTKGEKRKAAGPTESTGDKKGKSEGMDARVAQLETAFEHILNNMSNLTEQIKQQTENIVILSTTVQALATHTGLDMARKPPANPLHLSGDNDSSEASMSKSDARHPAGGPIRSHSVGAARLDPHRRS